MVCCVCLLETPRNLDIFEDIGQQLKIAEVIKKYLWFKPEPDSELSTKICTTCWHKLDDFHIFYQTAEKAHKEYEQSGLTNVKFDNPCSSPIKIELNCDEEEFIANSVPDAAKTNSQTQLNNLLEDSNNEEFLDITSEDEFCGSSDDYEPILSSNHDSTDEVLITDNDEIVEGALGVKKKTKRRQKRQKSMKKDKDNTKQRLDPVHTEEMIKKHIPMGCHLCVFVGTTFADIVRHFKNKHPKDRPFVTCCDKKFSQRFLLAQHALKHEDPNCFKCEECNKLFTTVRGLQVHNLAYHARNEDLIYSCESCPKKFARRNLLELHQTSHLPKEQWNYICNICPEKKKFPSAYLLNVHTNMRHKREINICPVCAKEIKHKKGFEKHLKEHYEGTGPKLKCPFPNCDSWLKDADNLKLHMQRHNTDGETFQCPLCDKIYPNRMALNSHKVYVHCKEAFKCEHCSKTFKRAITLREHVAQHTGEVLYNCPFCTRTFNSNANMHSHKKKQHPVEWAALRKKKICITPSKTLINTSSMF